MKTLSTKLSKSFCYPSRMGYERLEKEELEKKIQASSAITANRRRRPWHIKATGRFVVKLLNDVTCSKRWLVWVRDAYIKMMLNLATLSVYGVRYREPSTGRGVSGLSGFAKAPMKEYDRKKIVEIYWSVIARTQLAARDLSP